MNFSGKVYSLCKFIPKGKVTTYKEISLALKCKSCQAIGQALKKNPYSPQVPCHRVVCSNGSVGGFKGCKNGKEIDEKIRLLKEEGVEVVGNKINLEKFLFRFI